MSNNLAMRVREQKHRLKKKNKIKQLTTMDDKSDKNDKNDQ